MFVFFFSRLSSCEPVIGIIIYGTEKVKGYPWKRVYKSEERTLNTWSGALHTVGAQKEKGTCALVALGALKCMYTNEECPVVYTNSLRVLVPDK